MNTTSDSHAPTACAQCGLLGTGRFCSSCGSPLNLADESVSREIGSKLTKPLTTLLSFVKTAWLVVMTPRQFFSSYVTASPPLSELSFPLEGFWRRISPGRQRVMQPFQCLGVAIGLMVGLSAVNEWAWRVTGFSERISGMSFDRMEAAAEQNIRAFYQEQFGRPLRIVRKARLTGLSLIDTPAREIIRLLEAIYFPLVVLVFLRHRDVKRHVLVHYYVYAVAASLAVVVVCELLGIGVFVLLQGASAEAAVGLAMIPELGGYLGRFYFLVLLPILVFPKVLPVSRARVITATIVGGIAWMTANVIVTQLALFVFGVVWM